MKPNTIFIGLIGFVLIFSGCKDYKTKEYATNEENLYEISLELTIGERGEEFLTVNGEDSSSIEMVRVTSLDVSNRSGDIYVLDADYKEILVFDSTGNFDKTISGGYGRGPGEFEFPNSLTIDDEEENILVYDYTLRRVSVFNSSGMFMESFLTPVPSKSFVKTTDESLWFSRLGAMKFQLSKVDLAAEKEVEKYLEPSERDLEYYPRGGVLKLGKGADGELLAASLRPGIWYEFSKGEFIEKGVDLFADTEAWVSEEGIPVHPAASVGIGPIDNDKIGIVWRALEKGERGVPVLGNVWLEIFDKNTSDHVDSILLPLKQIGDIKFDNNNNLYVVDMEEYPKIKKFSISKK